MPRIAWNGFVEFIRIAGNVEFAGEGIPPSCLRRADTPSEPSAYDRWGNRWHETEVSGSGGPQTNLTFNTANNQFYGGGATFDAAGNKTSDGTNLNSYTYDADGNVISVSGPTTANYVYDALNHRVQYKWGSDGYNFVFDQNGQRVTSWGVSNDALSEGHVFWNGAQFEMYSNNTAHFQHQDYVGTRRATTDYQGNFEASYTSMPFGDGFAKVSGTDYEDFGQFATLDQDTTANDHAQFREYSNMQGRWFSPDPYAGSYDFAVPQTFNRYAYVLNNPLSFIDPLGLMCFETGGGTWSVSTGTGPGDTKGGTDPVVVTCWDDSTPYTLGYTASFRPPERLPRLPQRPATPNNSTQKLQQCVNNFYNSALGKAVQFGSPISLLPGWNPQWGSNLGDWGTAILGKLGGLVGIGAVPGTNELTTLSGTTTVGTKLELGTEAAVGGVEKVATPAMAVATAADIIAHGYCADQVNPGITNPQLTPGLVAP